MLNMMVHVMNCGFTAHPPTPPEGHPRPSDSSLWGELQMHPS